MPETKKLTPAELKRRLAKERGDITGLRGKLKALKNPDPEAKATGVDPQADTTALKDIREKLASFRAVRQDAGRRHALPGQSGRPRSERPFDKRYEGSKWSAPEKFKGPAPANTTSLTRPPRGGVGIGRAGVDFATPGRVQIDPVTGKPMKPDRSMDRPRKVKGKKLRGY